MQGICLCASLQWMPFFYLPKATSAAETTRKQVTIKRHPGKFNEMIGSYEIDNIWFAEAAFMESILRSNQQTAFCGVTFPNCCCSMLHIRMLQDQARTMMLHTQRRRPIAIVTCMWPRLTTEIHNTTWVPNQQDRKSPITLFAGSKILPGSFHHLDAQCLC